MSKRPRDSKDEEPPAKRAKTDSSSGGSNAIVEELVRTVTAIGAPGKGILASDENEQIMVSRFDFLGIPNTETNRIKIRDVIFRAPGK